MKNKKKRKMSLIPTKNLRNQLAASLTVNKDGFEFMEEERRRTVKSKMSTQFPVLEKLKIEDVVILELLN